MSQSPQRSWLWRSIQIIARIGATMMFDLKVYGKSNIPKVGGVLLLANHQSFLDPILVSVRLDRPVSFMAKFELFQGSRFFKWLITSLHAFPVKRGTGDVGAIKQAIGRLREGHVLNMYPEGTRTVDGEIRAIQPGIALVVKRAGVPIIPVVIDGSFDAWPKGAKELRFRPVRVMYGAPLSIEGMRPAELVSTIDRTLRHMLIDIRKK